VVEQVLQEEVASKREAAIAHMWGYGAGAGGGGGSGPSVGVGTTTTMTTQQLLSAANLQAAASGGAGASAFSGGGGGSGSAGGGDGGPVDSILLEMIPRWAPSESLAALGMDSLDLVQLRNTANRKLGMKAPLSTYMKPNRTLQELRTELQTLLAAKE